MSLENLPWSLGFFLMICLLLHVKEIFEAKINKMFFSTINKDRLSSTNMAVLSTE